MRVHPPGYLKYPSKRSMVILTSIVLSMLLFVRPVPVTAATLTEYALPSLALGQFSLPFDLAASDSNTIWFTESAQLQGNRIGRLEVAASRFVEFTIPTANSQPQGIVVLPANATPKTFIAFAEYATHKIGVLRYGVPTDFVEYALTGTAFPWGVAAFRNSTGNYIAFTESGTKKIGVIGPGGGLVEYIPRDPYTPRGIAVDSNNIIWFTELNPGGPYAGPDRIGKLNPANGRLVEYDIPGASTGVLDITVDAFDNIWFTEQTMKAVAMLNPWSGLITHYLIDSTVLGTPYGIAYNDDDGSIWFTTSKDMVVKLNLVSNLFIMHKIPAGAAPQSITVNTFTSPNEIWFVEYSASKLGRLTTLGAPVTTITTTSVNQTATTSTSAGTTYTTAESPGVTTTGITGLTSITSGTSASFSSSTITETAQAILSTSTTTIMSTQTLTFTVSTTTSATLSVPISTTTTSTTTSAVSTSYVSTTTATSTNTTTATGVLTSVSTTTSLTTSTIKTTLTTTRTTSSTSTSVSTTVTTRGLIPTQCVIAAAAYGSELAAPVQFLREFRDRDVEGTYLGGQFLSAFNAWYYSWAPAIAELETQNSLLRAFVRILIMPLLGILYAARELYVALAPMNSEAAILLTGLVASSLIGITYLTPPMLLAGTILRKLKRRISVKSKTLLAYTVGISIALAIFATTSNHVTSIPQILTATLVMAATITAPTAVTMRLLRIFLRTTH